MLAATEYFTLIFNFVTPSFLLLITCLSVHKAYKLHQPDLDILWYSRAHGIAYL